MNESFINRRSLKYLLLDAKFNPRQWNGVFNMSADYLDQLSQDQELNQEPRAVRWLIKGYLGISSAVCKEIAYSTGGRRKGMDIQDIERKSQQPNVIANRMADELYSAFILLNQQKRSYTQEVEASKGFDKAKKLPFTYALRLANSAAMGIILPLYGISTWLAEYSGGRKSQIPHF